MEVKKDKNIVFIIAAVIVICIIAMVGYTFSYKKADIKEQRIAVDKIDNDKKKVVNLKDVKNKIKTGKIIDIKDERSLCRIIDDSHYICNDSESIYMYCV